MSEEHEIEVRQLAAFKDVIKRLKEQHGGDNGTMGSIDIDALTKADLGVWDRYKELLKMIDNDIFTDNERFDNLKLNARELLSHNKELFSSGNGNEFLAWIGNRLNIIFSVIQQDTKSLPDALDDKRKYCL